jgi:hypothetical protein
MSRWRTKICDKADSGTFRTQPLQSAFEGAFSLVAELLEGRP